MWTLEYNLIPNLQNQAERVPLNDAAQYAVDQLNELEVLAQSKAIDTAGLEDARDEFWQLVEECDQSEFTEALTTLYNWADDERVWLGFPQ